MFLGSWFFYFLFRQVLTLVCIGLLSSAHQTTYQGTPASAALPRTTPPVAVGGAEEGAAVAVVAAVAWTAASVALPTHVHLALATPSPSCAFLATSAVASALALIDHDLCSKKTEMKVYKNYKRL